MSLTRQSVLDAGLALLAVGLAPAASPARAQVLDVEPAGASGDDLRFTWTGGTDDLLRGESPDALAPWLAMVDSPLVGPGENALGTGDPWSRLASGSNMAFRLELGVAVDGEPTELPLSLPERRPDVTCRDVLARYPAASQVVWHDGEDDRPEACGRIDGMLLGDDETLPPHGGALVTFTESTTARLVGSADPSVGWRHAELKSVTFPPFLPVPLGVPANSRLLAGFELLCGERGVDWIDADGDTAPDESCGTDEDGDGTTETGAWTSIERLLLPSFNPPEGAFSGSVEGAQDFIGLPVLGGRNFTITRGEAVVLVGSPEDEALDDGFRPPTW